MPNNEQLISRRTATKAGVLLAASAALLSETSLLSGCSDEEKEPKPNFSESVFTTESGTPVNRDQAALRETAMAYYRRGELLQYETARRLELMAPEDCTVQDRNFTVCSSFTYSVYRNALNIDIPSLTKRLNSAGNSGIEEIVFYRDEEALTNDLSTPETRTAMREQIMEQLKIGDVLTYYYDDIGHANFIHDFIYDESGKAVDAVLLQSTRNFDYSTTKLSLGLSYNTADPNEKTGIKEGTVKIADLSDIILRAQGAHSFTIYRPIIKDGKYRNLEFTAKGGTGAEAYNCSIGSEISYDLSDSAYARLCYPGIYVDKTCSAWDNNNVEPGQEITYTLLIRNDGNEEYKDLTVIQKISGPVSEGTVDGWEKKKYSGAAVGLKQVIASLSAGQQTTLTFSVIVEKNAKSGAEVLCEGSVGGLYSGLVRNYVYPQLTATQEELIRAAFTADEGLYSGVELIDRVYQDALGFNVNFSGLKLGALTPNSADSKTAAKNAKLSPYYTEDGSDALIVTNYGKTLERINLNSNNPAAGMILDQYYGAVAAQYSKNSTENAIFKIFDFEAVDQRAEAKDTTRADWIYPETLRTGDVLIYNNTNDHVTNEDGTYAFIFIDGQFVGRNKLTNGEDLNSLISTNEPNIPQSTPTIFGKDYYAIFRPAMTFAG